MSRGLARRLAHSTAWGLAVGVALVGCTSPPPTEIGPTVVLSTAPVDPRPEPDLYPSIEPSPDGPETVAPTDGEVVPDVFMASVNDDAGEVWVVVYVPGIIEEGGTCTVTLRSGDTTLTQVNEGVADVSSTACGLFAFPLSDVPRGEALITAEYLSATSAGVSPPAEVLIP